MTNKYCVPRDSFVAIFAAFALVVFAASGAVHSASPSARRAAALREQFDDPCPNCTPDQRLAQYSKWLKGNATCGAEGWKKQYFDWPTRRPDLTAIWGASSRDVYVSSYAYREQAILRYNGSWWQKAADFERSEVFFGAWGTAPNDVYFIGSVMAHYDGTTLSIGPKQRKVWNGIWGVSGSDAFAVGADVVGGREWTHGVIAHCNGTKWLIMPSPKTRELTAISGTSGRDVFAVGSEENGPGVAADGIVLHYDGSTWSEAPTTGLLGTVRGVWEVSPTDVYVVGDGVWHFDGLSWSPMKTDADQKLDWPVERGRRPEGDPFVRLESIWGSSPSDIFAVGSVAPEFRPDGRGDPRPSKGLVLHYDGTGIWHRMGCGKGQGATGRVGKRAGRCFRCRRPRHNLALRWRAGEEKALTHG